MIYTSCKYPGAQKATAGLCNNRSIKSWEQLLHMVTMPFSSFVFLINISGFGVFQNCSIVLIFLWATENPTMLPYLLIKTSVMFEPFHHALSNLELLWVDGWAEQHSCWNTTWGGMKVRVCQSIIQKYPKLLLLAAPRLCPGTWRLIHESEWIQKWITYLKGRALNPPGGPSVIVTFLLLRRKQDGFLLFQHSKSTKSVKASSEQHVTTCDLYFTIR